jgi:hypothetical protein
MHNFDQNLAQGSYHERVEERKTNKQTNTFKLFSVQTFYMERN